MPEENPIAAAYLDEVRRALRGYKRLADGAMAQLQNSELFYAPDTESNSVAVIVKHISGNMRSRFTDFLTTDGEKPTRHRDQEFEMAPDTRREQLLAVWEESWKILFETIASLQPGDLTRTVYIRQEPHTVLQALNRAQNHYAHHVGQILYVAKMIRKSEWKSLSVPRGKSEEYNAMKVEDRRFIPLPRS
jgi:hypothetical protein